MQRGRPRIIFSLEGTLQLASPRERNAEKNRTMETKEGTRVA